MNPKDRTTSFPPGSSPLLRKRLQHNPYVDSFPQTSLSPYATISSSSHPDSSSYLFQHPYNHQLQVQHLKHSSIGIGITNTVSSTGVVTGGIGTSKRNVGGTKFPQRTTKTAQKLVILPASEETAQAPHIVNEVDNDIEAGESVTLTADHELARTIAERMSKEQRFLLPRVTSYSTARSYNLEEISDWVRDAHAIRAKLYDECLYICYYPHGQSNSLYSWGGPSYRWMTVSLAKDNKTTEIPFDPRLIEEESELPSWMFRREVFVFDYGVVVLWNFTQEEEQYYLESLKPFSDYPLELSDMEIENLHFQYDVKGPMHPRIFNDMITLKSGNPLIKLTISHAVAQSTKLLQFETMIEYTIEDAIDFPKMMAKYGEVSIPRDEIMKVVGKLFQLRMDVNLISNVLDAPEIFWSEIELEQFYSAIRGYMEITQRVGVLNSKTQVISDLVDMLSDHANSNQMNYITWIIIGMIGVAVVVAALEVWVKSWHISE